MVVLSDADLDRAAAGAAWGGMVNGGQGCVSVERVYVEAPVYDDFVARVTDEVRKIRVGSDGPGEFSCEYGAMITSDQLRIVERHVSDAVEKGAGSSPAAAPSTAGSSNRPYSWTSTTRWPACGKKPSGRRCRS